MKAALVLAAGASRRLGELKQLAMLGDETLLERAVRVCREAGCEPVLVVVGAEYAQVLGNSVLDDTIPVVNDKWEEGMGASIRVGMGALRFADKDAEGVVIAACDMPAVTAEHLRELMREGGLAGSEYAGRLGVPAYFPAASFGALMELKGDAGARALLVGARAVRLVGGEMDVDTPEDLARALGMFRRFVS